MLPTMSPVRFGSDSVVSSSFSARGRRACFRRAKLCVKPDGGRAKRDLSEDPAPPGENSEVDVALLEEDFVKPNERRGCGVTSDEGAALALDAVNENGEVRG